MKPWERYAQPEAGPWAKYAAPLRVEINGTAADEPSTVASIAAGLGKGVGQVALGAQHYAGKGLSAVGLDSAGNWLVDDAAHGRAKLESELAPYSAAHPIAAGAGELGGQVLATLPVGGLIAAPVKAAAGAVPRLAPLADAIASAGMRAGGVTGVPGMATRMAGGAITGGAAAGLVDPEMAGTGAVIGAALPPAIKGAAAVGSGIAGTVRPFFDRGQRHIAADVLREYANDPQSALAALRNARPVVPGSMPTTAAASGDVGLSGLMRTMQNASGDFAGDLANRQSAQNAARLSAIEGAAGTKGAVSVAEAARDAVTGPLREGVLQRAGKLSADDVIAGIERMMADPNNAGATTRTALRSAIAQIRDVAEKGKIDARALYQIRKDLGLAMQGKLQGEAGNLRYARGALDRVQGLFDDAIDLASRKVPSGQPLLPGSQPATAWRDYLQTYSQMSRPIDRMEALQDVLKRIQNATTDTQGNLILSSAKLNNILKNEGDELAKLLTPDQLQLLRDLAADLNASQLSMTAGKAVGSNTVQNLAQDQLLRQALGSFGGSTPVRTTLGNLLKLPYIRANQQIQQKIGEALLDPAVAAGMLGQQPILTSQLAALLSPVGGAAVRAAPILPASRQ